MLDLNLIKAKPNNEAEKFSIHLYRFIKNWRKERERVMPEGDVKIYSDGKSYYIGRKTSKHNFIGRRLNQVCNGVRGYKESYAYPNKLSEILTDVSKAFFDKYLQIGKCAIAHDKDNHYWHFFMDSDDGEIKTCINCGLVMKKKVTKVEKYITTWEIK